MSMSYDELPEGLKLFSTQEGRSRFVGLAQMGKVLTSDANRCLNMVVENDTDQFNRRVFIRAVVAMIEGATHGAKMLIMGDSDAVPPGLTLEEFVVLREIIVELKDNGTPKLRPSYPKITDNLIFTYNLLARFFGVEIVIDKSGTGWTAFKATVEIRNRLMHPKGADLLFVSDAEMAAVIAGYRWFESIASVWKKIIEAAVEKVPQEHLDLWVSKLSEEIGV